MVLIKANIVEPTTANIGTPFLLTLENSFGASPFCASENNMRELVYNPEFKQDSNAMRITIFMIRAAEGIPSISSTATNGLFSKEAEFHGNSVTRMAMDPI